MILLDTNVMSEPLRSTPEPRVIAWIDAQPMETLFLSAITVAELRAGVALLPAGKRRAGLQENLEKRVLPLFAGRVLPFDLACTQAYAALMAKARSAGLAIATAEGYITAIAAANGFAVATRDTRPFEASGTAVINPWQA
jgi:predicted nucleic acid-binding protein